MIVATLLVIFLVAVFLCVRDLRPRKPVISWAEQRRADRVLWSGMQREAMVEWEDRCQCPAPRTFLDYRTGKPLDEAKWPMFAGGVRWQYEQRERMPRPDDMHRPMGPRAPQRDFNQWMRDQASQYQRYEA